PTTCQSKILQDNVPDADAACAEKLAAAGTVLIGKTTTHEFADGGPSFDLPQPPARNPWNTEHFTAGSSSGTGAGVAAGLILGVIHHFHEVDYKVSDATRRAIDAAIATLRELGGEIREVQLAPLQDWGACGSLISITERATAYEEWAKTRLGDFSERVQRRLM